jgi:uncharacterized protein
MVMDTHAEALPEYGLVVRLIEEDAQIAAIYGEVQARMQCDSAHDTGHLLRVACWTIRLGGETVSPGLAAAAALLHDVVNLPKNDPRRSYAGVLSSEVAREVLGRLGFSEEDTSLVAAAVRDHSFSLGATPTSSLGRALQDADRLEALGALGVFRCIAVGTRLNAAFFHPSDPWAQGRPLDDRHFSVDHFFTKLLRLPESFLTAAGRAEAKHRAEVMRQLLVQLGREIGQLPPSPLINEAPA